MRKYRRTLPAIVLLMLLTGCTVQAQIPPTETEMPIPGSAIPAETEPVTEETVPVREYAEETQPASVTEPNVSESNTLRQQTESRGADETQPVTVPEEAPPPETVSPETQPPTTEAPAAEPMEPLPPSTEPKETERPAEETEEAAEPLEPEITYEFKRQVAAYAAQYINQYRGAPCTVLPGMSQVAQYRAGQLTWNFAHSTADKRVALAYYAYGRWIDATLAGLDESDSYYESDTAEAICRNFHGEDAQTLGKAIADLIRGSGSHWAYVGSSEYSFMGVGVEYRDGWYACVMVGTENYG